MQTECGRSHRPYARVSSEIVASVLMGRPDRALLDASAAVDMQRATAKTAAAKRAEDRLAMIIAALQAEIVA
eukprot:IDg2480t1